MSSRLEDDIRRSTDWLVSIQHESGAWGQYQGANPNVLNTAEALIALVQSDRYSPTATCIQKGVAYITSQQTESESASEDGSWSRSIGLGGGATLNVEDTVRTCFSMLALQLAGGYDAGESISKGMQWLKTVRNPDGGWSYSSSGDTQLLPTCLATQVFLMQYEEPGSQADDELKTIIREAVACICSSHRNNNASFGGPNELRWPHTLLALETLATARRLGVGDCPPSQIRDAESWIRDQGSPPRWANETIRLAKDGADASYTFTHIAPAIYLNVLGARHNMDGQRISEPDRLLARGSLRLLEARRDDDSHAFGTIRPVSWATAKTVMGLHSVMNEFPVWPEEMTPTSTPTLFVLALLAIAALASLAALLGSLPVELVIILVMIELGLLGFGRVLGEQALTGLLKELIGKLPSISIKGGRSVGE